MATLKFNITILLFLLLAITAVHAQTGGGGPASGSNATYTTSKPKPSTTSGGSKPTSTNVGNVLSGNGNLEVGSAVIMIGLGVLGGLFV